MNARNELKTHIRRDQLMRLLGTEVKSKRGKAAILKACETLREATAVNRVLRLKVNRMTGSRKNGIAREGAPVTAYARGRLAGMAA